MANLTNTQRIGALVPATNPVVEPDFYRVVPPEITVHFERMWNGTWGSQPEAPPTPATSSVCPAARPTR